MKNFTLKISALVCMSLLLIATFSSSCKKDKTCHGKVTVVDTAGAPVASASVVLGAPSVNGTITYKDVTDGSGVVNFEIKLPCILDITATKSSMPGMTGKGILRVDEPGKSDEVTVTMKP